LLVASFTQPAKAVDNEDALLVIGGILGGLAGNQIGKGNGKAAATILLATVGALVGKEIGETLDEQGRREMVLTHYDALSDEDFGKRYEWHGSRSYGEVQVLRRGYLEMHPHIVCQEYRQVTNVQDRYGQYHRFIDTRSTCLIGGRWVAPDHTMGRPKYMNRNQWSRSHHRYRMPRQHANYRRGDRYGYADDYNRRHIPRPGR